MKKLTFIVLASILLIGGQYADAACYNVNYNARLGMRDGTTSNNVSTLQGFLREFNYLAPGPVGYFGPSTFAAVVKFQRSRGLTSDGVVGPMTRAAIKTVSCTTASNPIDQYFPTNPNPYNPYIPSTGTIGNTSVYTQNYLSTHNLYDGSNVIYRYKVTAPDTASVSISNETFSFVQSGVRTSNLKLQVSNNDYFSYNTAESYIVYDSGLDSTTYLARDIQFSFPTTVIIPAGQTRYFQVVQQVAARNSGAYVRISHSRMGTENMTTDGSSASRSIYITYPNTNSPLTRGSTYTIQWNTTQFDSSRTLNLSLVNTDGTSYTIGSIQATNSNYGEYAWTIPGSIPTKSGYQVKIESGGVSDVSDTTFSIVDSNPSITVTSPASGDVWNLDSTTSKTISWTYSGFGDSASSRAATVGLMFPDGTTCALGNTTLGALSFPVTIRSNSCTNSTRSITPGQYKIGMGAYSLTGSAVIDYSDPITITSTAVDPTLMQVLSPNGGESLTVTQSTNITWNTPSAITNSDTVNIYLDVYASGATTAYKRIILATSLPNSKTYAWTVPSTLAGSSYVSTDRYKIVISATKSSAYVDASNDYFNITSTTRLITLTAPTQTSISRDTDFTVGWNKAGFLNTDKINIVLVPLSGATVTLKSNVFAQDGSATVRIPLTTALNTYRIRLVPVSYTFGTGSVTDSNLFALTNKSGYSITPANISSPVAKGYYTTTAWTSSGLTGANITIRLLAADDTVIAGTSVTVAASLGTKDIMIPSTLPNGSYKFKYEGVSDGSPVTAYSNTFTVGEPSYGFSLDTNPTTATKNTAVTIGWTESLLKSADPVVVIIKDSTGQTVTKNTTIGAGSASITVPTTFATGTATIYATTTASGYTRNALGSTRTINIVDQVFPSITVLTPAGNTTSGQVVTATWQNANFSAASVPIASLRVSLVQKKGSTVKTAVIESGLSPLTTSIVIPVATNGTIGNLTNVGIDTAYIYQIKVEGLSSSGAIYASGITQGGFSILK